MNDERDNNTGSGNQPPDGNAFDNRSPHPPVQQGQTAIKTWYIGRNNKQTGPFTVGEITNLIQMGKVLPSDLAWKKGMPNWVQTDTLPEFAGTFPPPQPPGAAPQMPPPMDNLRQEATDKARKVVDASKIATGGAFSAFKIFALNPISGLRPAYESLGNKLAFSAGIVFFVAFEILMVIACLNTFASMFESVQVGDLIRVVVLIAIPFAATTICLFGVRVGLKGKGILATDVFVAGVALLPLGFLAFLSSLLGGLGFEFLFFLFIFGECYAAFVIFAGLNKLYEIPESKSVFIVPTIIALAIWLSVTITKVVFADLF